MKFSALFLIAAFSTFAWASNADWNVVAETIPGACEEKIQILAKTGEKYVMVARGEMRDKLYSKDKSAFNREDSVEVQFESLPVNGKLIKPTFLFTKPSIMNGSPAKIEVTQSGSRRMCKMALK